MACKKSLRLAKNGFFFGSDSDPANQLQKNKMRYFGFSIQLLSYFYPPIKKHDMSPLTNQ
jgi:hypothetical protein